MLGEGCLGVFTAPPTRLVVAMHKCLTLCLPDVSEGDGFHKPAVVNDFMDPNLVLNQSHFIAQVNTIYTNTIVTRANHLWICGFAKFTVAIFQDLLQLDV